MFGYNQRENHRDFITGIVSFNIPLYSGRKQRKKVEEKTITVNQLKEQYNNVQNNLLYRINNIFEEIDQDNNLLNLYKTGVIPQTYESLNSAVSGYEVNKVDFLTLINNQITLFNYEIEYYRILADHEIQVAKLEYLAGRELF